MRKYIEHVKQRSPHERRQVAVRIASSITGVIFIGWLATLGVRLAAPHPKTAAEVSGFTNQVASIAAAFSFKAKEVGTLEVSTTTNY